MASVTINESVGHSDKKQYSSLASETFAGLLMQSTASLLAGHEDASCDLNWLFDAVEDRQAQREYCEETVTDYDARRLHCDFENEQLSMQSPYLPMPTPKLELNSCVTPQHAYSWQQDLNSTEDNNCHGWFDYRATAVVMNTALPSTPGYDTTAPQSPAVKAFVGPIVKAENQHQNLKRKCFSDDSDESFSSETSSPTSLGAFMDSPDLTPNKRKTASAKRRRMASANPATPGTTPGKAPQIQKSSETSYRRIQEHDPANKPAESQLELIARAILSVPEKRMILGDIYDYIFNNYTYYQTAPEGWKNTVRYNLSTSECFFQGDKAPSGRGFYWTIHEACVEDFLKGDFNRRQVRQRVQLAQKQQAETCKKPNASHRRRGSSRH